MPKSPKSKKKRNCSLPQVFKSNLNSKPVCDGNTCSFKPSPSSTSTRTIYAKFNNNPEKKYNNSTDTCSANNPEWEGLLPPEFWEGFKEAMQKGLVISFLCTLTEDVVTDIMKKNKYNSEQIYCANQIIKALLLVIAGNTIGKSFASPFVSVVLEKTFGFKKDLANTLSIAGILATDLVLNPLTFAKFLTVSSLVVTGFGVSKLTHFSYKKTKDLLNQASKYLKDLSETPVRQFKLA